MPHTFDISVVIPTCNRAQQLGRVLERLRDQDAGEVRYEVVVVDNNSTDDTRRVIEAVAGTDPDGRIRYLFEPCQGVSYARNAGVANTTAPVVAFLDDDGMPDRDWVLSMKRAFDAHPEADCIGGRIKPRWIHARPSWLTAAHWGAIAVQDRPRVAYLNTRQASACLLGANLGCRRDAILAVGGFSPDYPRGQDREFQMRLWRAGKQGLYLPAIDVTVDVPPERLTRHYHRRWQATTGKYHALMRFRDTLSADGAMVDEPVALPTIFGSPRFLYRAFLGHLLGLLRAAVMSDSDRRFFHETRLWYHVSFFWTRWRNPAPARDVAPAPRGTAGNRAVSAP
jgi:glycosyltransferase involved in cell wall biosynthesis